MELAELNRQAVQIRNDVGHFCDYLAVLEKAESRLSDAEREASIAGAMAQVEGFFARMATLREAALMLERQRPIVEIPVVEPEDGASLLIDGREHTYRRESHAWSPVAEPEPTTPAELEARTP